MPHNWYFMALNCH